MFDTGNLHNTAFSRAKIAGSDGVAGEFVPFEKISELAHCGDHLIRLLIIGTYEKNRNSAKLDWKFESLSIW